MATDTATTRFEIGRVIGDTFEVLGRNLVPFLLVALVLAGVPALVQTLIMPQRAALMTGGANWGNWALMGSVFSIIKVILSVGMQGALVTGAIASLNGGRVDLGDMLERGLSAALPLFGLAILYGFGLLLGLVLLIIPGLILLVIWSVAVPSLVIERTGVFGAFSRSSDLTRGRRWAIFGLMVVYAVLAWIVTAIGGALMLAFSGGLGAIAQGGSSFIFSPVSSIFNAVVATVLGALSASGVAALYYQLRLTKEGVAPQALLDTFS